MASAYKMLTSPSITESPSALQKAEEPIAQDVVDLVHLDGGDERAEHGVENAPGVPGHHIDGIQPSPTGRPPRWE